MYFPVIVKDCRKVEYLNKKEEQKVGYSVTIVTEAFETFSVFLNTPFNVGEPAILTITSGKYYKPVFSLERVIG